MEQMLESKRLCRYIDDQESAAFHVLYVYERLKAPLNYFKMYIIFNDMYLLQ